MQPDHQMKDKTESNRFKRTYNQKVVFVLSYCNGRKREKQVTVLASVGRVINGSSVMVKAYLNLSIKHFKYIHVKHLAC